MEFIKSNLPPLEINLPFQPSNLDYIFSINGKNNALLGWDIVRGNPK